MDTKALGQLGEKLACEYLVGKGLKILGKNYRISFGEIDIIAVQKWRITSAFKKRPIHFVEVKALQGYTPQTIFPEEHVNFKKREKLKNLAQIWLQKHTFSQNHPYQIDVIGVVIDGRTRKAQLHYFPNAVEEV